MSNNGIHKVTGSTPGATLAVFAGIHGNEKAGILALHKLIEDIQVVSGTVFFVFANPSAIEQDVRYVHQNLNRLFNRSCSGDTYEFERAHELMDILDQCDALLDLHSYNSEAGEPFVIAESNARDITQKLNVAIVASGFGDMGYGTDDYMYRNGKIGICLECGTSNKYMEFVEYAEHAAKQFLQHFGCIDVCVEDYALSQDHVKVTKLVKKQTESFTFSDNFYDFEVLPTDRPFIIDGEELFANPGEVIMFPRPDVAVGEEVCIVGEFIE